MKENPFKFGSIVDEPYFTNRIQEIEQVKSIIESQNHLTIIRPCSHDPKTHIQDLSF